MAAIAEKIENRASKIDNLLQIQDCRLADYRETLQLQHQLRDKRQKEHISDTVLIAEHHPVITLGARKTANKLVVSCNELNKKGIELVETRRGGGITAHNPGQLVFYPILNLQQLDLGLSEYVRKLEQIGIELLAQLSVSAQRKNGFPGLWLGDKKIASVGVRLSRTVTFHGMAINIQNDLSIFDLFVPCGLEGVEMTSVMKETGKRYSMEQVKRYLIRSLRHNLSNSNRIRDTRYEPRATSHKRPATSRVRRKLPPWLRRPLPAGKTYNRTKDILNSLGIETICTNANCPNTPDCWSRGTAAVLILGNICTRGCKFCSVATGKPEAADPSEPQRLTELVEQLALKYLVITSVTRDDLPDGGAGHFRNCINTIRDRCPDVKFEILTPDFRSCQKQAIELLRDALPFVFAHNIETVASLYRLARAGADYQTSLNLLKLAKQNYPNTTTKSSIMLGLGETDAEIEQVLKDLRSVGCDRITIGQYLKPSRNCLDVVEYIPPEKFDCWKHKAASLGFSRCLCEPFARSSYLAEQDHGLTRANIEKIT